MKSILEKLTAKEYLTASEAEKHLIEITEGKHDDVLVSSFLTIYMMRALSIEELNGFRNALLNLCVKVDLSDYDAIDLCGTGGDNKNTFNISTLSSFITAGSGIKVSKHGNYGISSNCGSSNVLEFFGIKFSNDESFLKNCIEKAGICFLHAPLFHPAMKNVASVRKNLGIKTFFNILGPLVNPANPKNQLTGVYNLETARLYGYFFQNTNKNYTITFSLDGYDEISLTGPTKMIRNSGEFIFEPHHFGYKNVGKDSIVGGSSIKESAFIFKSILEGNGSEDQNNVVCANAAMAISTYKNLNIDESLKIAEDSLYNKKALKSFEKLIKI
ncbi:MAG: anthranilate phosphoribosyltransferase [Flavobacteriaceae bacterium]